MAFKYEVKEDAYNLNVIDNIIFNEKSHLVAKFKDYLITDDEYEFLKRYYNEEEARIRLKKFLKYYHEYSLFYPNYSLLPESEIIYRNINSKQNIIDNIQNKNSNNNNNNNNSEENKNSLLFNSKVYNSIIKESTNCLSILSYDKEANCNNEDENKNASIAGINELINTFEKIDLNLKTKNEKEIKSIKQNKNLNIDLNNISNSNNSNKNIIYTKKRTPNNSINKKYTNKRVCNNSYNLTQKTINNFSFEKDDIKNCNKDMNKAKHENLNRTKNESGSFLIDNKKNPIYKKINLLGNSARIYNHSSLSITASSKEKEKESNIIDKKVNYNSLPKSINKNKTLNKKKVSNIKTKNLLTEQIPRIKVNLKKVEADKENIKRKDSNPRTIGHRKLTLNDNKSSNLNIRENLGKSYLYNKKLSNNDFNNLNNKSLTSRNNENKRSNYHLVNSKEKNDVKKNYNKISFKNNKINLIKNKEEYTQHFNFIINNYNSKLTTYNTSIKLNSNINIYNSNNIIDNKYDNTPYNNSNDSDLITNNTNNNFYEKKIAENKSYKFLDNKFIPNKKFFLSSFINNKKKNSFCKETFNTINKRTSIEKSLINNNNVSNSNSERISTPFNIRQNKKLISKLNNNTINQNYKTITMKNRGKHISIIRQKNNNKKLEGKNYMHLNITSNSISNITNNSFIRIKTESDSFSNNFGKSYIRKGKFDNINKIKKNNNFFHIKNSNNINKDKIKKKINDNELKDIKEYRERKINRIIAESKEQRDEYIRHLKLLLGKKYNNNTSRIEQNNLEKLQRNIIFKYSKK